MAFDFSTLIVDRTVEDVSSGARKGGYDYTDIARVQAAARELKSTLESHGYIVDLAVLPAWSEASEVTVADLESYLSNVHTLRDTLGLRAPLPSTMARLTYGGANQIEAALAQLEDELHRIRQSWPRSGQIMSGGDGL